jgi:ribosome maturation factor RimP
LNIGFGDCVKEQQVISAEVSNLGYSLVDIEREGRGLLRVTIENQDFDRLITVEDCEKVSHQLTYTLAVENVPYERLEVSSPGLDRPIKSADDFVRFAGLEIELKLRVAVSGRKNFKGVLQGLKSGSCNSPDAKFSLLFEASDGSPAELEFGLSEVEKARLVPVIDFKGRKS